MQKLAIFDFDGCLVHTLDAWMLSVREVLGRLGIEATDKEIVDNVFANDQKPTLLGVKDLDAFWEDNVATYHTKFEYIHPHEGAAETLQLLKNAGVAVAVLTRTEKKSLDLILNNHPELKEHIDYACTREMVTHHKPHPEGIYHIQDHFGIDSAHTFVIGDSEHDVLAGESAGATTILYYPPYNEPFYSIDEITALNADHLVHHFREITPIVI